MRKYSYRIFGVVAIIIGIFSVNFNVSAAKSCDTYVSEMKTACKKTSVKSVYELKMKKVGENQFKISINSDDITNKDSDTFVVTKIVGTHNYNDLSSLKITKKNPLTLNIIPLNSEVKVTVKLEQASSDFGASCLGKYNSIKSEISQTTQDCDYEGRIKYTFKYSTAGTTSRMKSSAIDYNELKDLISEAKSKNVINKNLQKTIDAGLVNDTVADTTTKSLTCNYKSSKNYFVNELNQNTIYNGDSEYYSNTNYFYTEDAEPRTKYVTYTYNGTNRDSKDAAVCDIKCREAIKVEYGPPVASKAGLCFEYRVKVTSYVDCNSNILENYPQESEYEVCTPKPECYNESLGVLTQGGPKEEYESCIRECDGGKYTRSCSNKCYKKVYGTSSSNMNLALINDADLKNIANDESKKCSNNDGCYYWSGKKIKWQSAKTNTFWLGNEDWDVGSIGRWYRLQNSIYNPEDKFSGHTYTTEEGIFKATDCDEVCNWDNTECTKKDFLNPQDAEDSKNTNVQAWKNKLAECEAAASCSTKIATFTISVTYNHEKNEQNKTQTTIEFPYSTKDELKSLGKDEEEGVDNTGIKNLVPNESSSVLNYDGCYSETTAQDWYQTEWSFPGTWINNKTGDINYQGKPGDGWHQEKNKFCIPLNAKSVNTKWWEWDQLDNSCWNEEEILGELKDNYNIKASTKDFGYFGWNFDINCFYALRNEECVENNNGCCPRPPGPPNGDPECEDGCCDDTCTNPVNNYSFRVIDTSDMFPDPDGTGSEGRDPSATGREPGFNWTKDATDNSIDDYEINPEELIKTIQGRKESVYNGDKYLEYYFELSTQDLAKIKRDVRDTKDDNYTDFSKSGITFGDIPTEKNPTKASFYTSKLIDQYGKRNTKIGVNYGHYGT